ncbi:MAG: hypothetical protein DWQ29_08265, partial [Planctomycetota bacterium]
MDACGVPSTSQITLGAPRRKDRESADDGKSLSDGTFIVPKAILQEPNRRRSRIVPARRKRSRRRKF